MPGTTLHLNESDYTLCEAITPPAGELPPPTLPENSHPHRAGSISTRKYLNLLYFTLPVGAYREAGAWTDSPTPISCRYWSRSYPSGISSGGCWAASSRSGRPVQWGSRPWGPSTAGRRGCSKRFLVRWARASACGRDRERNATVCIECVTVCKSFSPSRCCGIINGIFTKESSRARGSLSI